MMEIVMIRPLNKFLFFAGVALLAIGAQAQSGSTGTVKGSVSRAEGAIEGARVTISSGTVSSYSATTTTDKEGSFSFSSTPLGEVEVRVYDSQDNLIVSGKGVLNTAGETITLVLSVS